MKYFTLYTRLGKGVRCIAHKKSFEANLVGHSSPNGSSGEVSKDTSGLTTALHIVKRITVIIQ